VRGASLTNCGAPDDGESTFKKRTRVLKRPPSGISALSRPAIEVHTTITNGVTGGQGGVEGKPSEKDRRDKGDYRGIKG